MIFQMERIRNSIQLARFVLVWFVLSLGVAMASPLVSTKAMNLVCTTGGVMKFVSSDDADSDTVQVQSTDCALCMAVGIPPAPVANHFTKPSSLAHALHPIASAHIASATAPPLPSRGPPVL